METHVNAWPVIARLLKKHKLAQRDLADYLEITASAVTQAKRERMLFSYLQLALICDFFGLRRTEISELFSAVLNARLARSTARSTGKKPRLVHELQVTIRPR